MSGRLEIFTQGSTIRNIWNTIDTNFLYILAPEYKTPRKWNKNICRKEIKILNGSATNVHILIIIKQKILFRNKDASKEIIIRF